MEAEPGRLAPAELSRELGLALVPEQGRVLEPLLALERVLARVRGPVPPYPCRHRHLPRTQIARRTISGELL